MQDIHTFSRFKIHKFKIHSRIGEGFQAQVFLVSKANKAGIEKLYALKIFNKGSLDESTRN